MPREHLEERLLLERVELHVRQGGNGRRSCAVVKERNLTEAVAPAERVDAHAVDEHLEVSFGNGEVVVALPSLRHDRRPGRSLERLEAPSNPLQSRRRERREQAQRPQQPDLDDRHRGRCIEREEAPADQERQQRKEQAGADDGGRRSPEMHEEGREHRSDGNPCAHQAFEHPEDARQHLGRRRALEERPPGHVEQAVCCTGHDEEKQCGHNGGQKGQEDERSRPRGERADDRGDQTRATHERCRDGDRKRTTETECRIQVPRTAVPHPEHAHREHDVEDVQHPEGDLLRAEDPDERSCRGLTDDDREPLDQLPPDARARRRIRGRAGDRGHEHCSTENGYGHDEEDPARAGDGENEAGECGCDENAGALVPAGDDVRRRQLLGSAAETRGESSHRRPRHRRRRGGHGGAGIRECRRAVEQQHRGRCTHRGGLDEVAQCQHPGGAVAIAEHGREGGEQRRRDHLDKGDETGRRGAAAPVGVHEHRYPDGPFGTVEGREGDLDAADVRVASDDRDDAANEADVLLHGRYSRERAITRRRSSKPGISRMSSPTSPAGITSVLSGVKACAVAVRA